MGGNFFHGFATGAIVSGLNHGMHKMVEKMQKSEPWDLNGDGKLQKNEADAWWENGNGQNITVDNSKIDWSGLKVPGGTKTGDFFGIDTHNAFIDLPYETAATYGGTSFVKVGSRSVAVLDQKYHYEYRQNNSIKNVVRNFMNWFGKPSIYGTDYFIQYSNPIFQVK